MNKSQNTHRNYTLHIPQKHIIFWNVFDDKSEQSLRANSMLLGTFRDSPKPPKVPAS
jgi:hypothetical protein